MQENSPLWNMEAEQSVLGAALQADWCAKLTAEMSAEEFTTPEHRTLHAAICALVNAGKPVDLITMDNQLGPTKGNEALSYMLHLIQYVPTTVNAKHYIDIVHKCSLRRKLQSIGQQLMENAAAWDREVDEVREWAATAIRDVHIGNADPIISMHDACLNTFEKLDKLQQRNGEPDPNRIMSGISVLDAKLGGLIGSKLVVIGARPSVGKSILALTFCVGAAKQGKRVLLVSLEMDETEITERVLANAGNVPLNAMTNGTMDADHWMGISEAIGPVSNLPLYYCLEANTVERVRRVAFSLFENGGLDMIAIDYLQLMEATHAKKQSREQQVSEISRGLRRLSQELKIPVIALTQLNRQSVGSQKGQTVKRQPTMSEARESGAIEQDANIFMLLHDPGIEEMRNDEEKQIWKSLKDNGMSMFRIIIDKNRQGKRGILTVAFDGDHMRFLPIVRQQPPAEEAEDEEDPCTDTVQCSMQLPPA